MRHPVTWLETQEEIESQFRQKEDRLKMFHGEHVDELEERIETLVKRNKTLIQVHNNELEEERQRRKKDLQIQAEEHKQTIAALKASKHFRVLIFSFLHILRI